MTGVTFLAALLFALYIAQTTFANTQNVALMGPAKTQSDRQNAPSEQKVVAAAPGRIEGSGEPIPVGASITGIVEKIDVRQGEKISSGQVLLRIACNDVKAQLATRIAEHDAAESVYRRLVNGARKEDIEIAQSELKLSEARLAEAETRVIRSSTLAQTNAVSAAVREIDDRDARVAAAQRDAARHRLDLLLAGTREEELAEAKARMIAAKHSIEVTKWEFSKCEVKSPVDGIVLRKHVSEGELVSLFFPKPLLTISEVRNYRVRAEVDEHDLQHIKKGQHVEVVAFHSDKRRLQGRVSGIAPVMGRRQILTSDPADKSDRDVVEVLVDLESKPENLPVGLRVSVIFFE